MRFSTLNIALSCVMIFVSVACQIRKPASDTENYLPSPEFTFTQKNLDETRLVQIYEQAQLGVVSIRTVNEGRTRIGSGFILDREGHVLTNAHVMSGGGPIEVLLPSGKLWEGKLIGEDEYSDLAVLQIAEIPDNLHPLLLGESDQARIGQYVLAIGNPVGLQNTMTTGIVSGVGRAFRNYGKVDEMQAFNNASVIQTDAAINQGSSGGPLLDLNANVIGIISSRLTQGFENSVSGIGFSISSEVIKVIVPDLIEQGKFRYPYLGILSVGDLNLAERKALGLEETSGVYVAEVFKGSPAEFGGLAAGSQNSSIPGVPAGGDIIISVDGIAVATFEDLMAYIVLQKIPGEEVVITAIRGGEQSELKIKLGSRTN